MKRGCALFLAVICLAAVVALPLAAREPDGQFEKTLTVTGPVDLGVGTGSGSIEIVTGNSGKVVIIGKIYLQRNFLFRRGSEEDVREVEANPPIVQDGNRIRVGELPRNLQNKITISYIIHTPAATQVKASAGSGSVSVNGVAGPVSASTGSGSVRIEDVSGGASLSAGSGSIRATRVGGEFSAGTGSGSIRAELIDGGPVELSAGSGSIRVSGVSGALAASTGSGSIVLDGSPTGDWEVKTGSGGVRVVFPSDASFELAARTSSGDIDTDFPITIQGRVSVRRNRLEGKVGEGGPKVVLRTSSGSIRVEKSDKE